MRSLNVFDMSMDVQQACAAAADFAATDNIMLLKQ
jgi:hypothetical protein